MGIKEEKRGSCVVASKDASFERPSRLQLWALGEENLEEHIVPDQD